MVNLLKISKFIRNKLDNITIPLFISLRFSMKYKGNKLISLISIISIIGIAIGVAILIICLSVMNGFEHELKERILKVIPHGEIESINQPWKNWLKELKKIENINGVVSVAPYVSFIGLLEKNNNSCVSQVRGVDIKREQKLITLSQFCKNCFLDNFESGNQQIIIGSGISHTLNLKLNDWVTITFLSKNFDNKISHQVKKIRLHVSGILKLNSQLDCSLVLIPLKDARKYLNIGNGITGMSIKVDNIFNADKIILHASQVINDYTYFNSWMDTYGYIYHDIKMVRTVIYLVIAIVIGISCFNIISMLLLVIKSRETDIAILRTLGADNNFIYAIFIWCGLIIGLTGGLLGNVLGILISFKITNITNYIENITGYSLISKNIYFINFIPSELHWQNILYISTLVFLLVLLSTLYPSWKATIIDPVKILKNN